MPLCHRPRRRVAHPTAEADRSERLGFRAPGAPLRRSFDILNPDPATLPQALARTLDAAQKARVVFGLVIEPVVLRRDADQHSGRFSIAGNDDLLTLGFVQKP